MKTHYGITDYGILGMPSHVGGIFFGIFGEMKFFVWRFQYKLWIARNNTNFNILRSSLGAWRSKNITPCQ